MASRNREQRTTLVIEPSKRAAVVGALQTLRKHPGAVSISNIDNHGNLSIVAKNAASLDKLLDIVDAASRAAAARGRAAAAAAAGRGRGFAAGGPSDAGRGGGAGRGQWVGEGRGGGRGRGGKVREEGRSDHAWISELSAGTEGPELTTPSLLLCLIDMGYLAGYYEARYQPETGLGFVQSLLAVASCFSQLSEIESVAESLKSGSAVSLASPRFVMTPKLLAEWTGLLKAQRTEKAAVEEALRLVESFSFAVGAEALHRVPLCFCLTGPWSVLGSAAAPFFERATFYCLGEALVTPGPLVGAEKPPVFIPIRDCLPPHFNEAPRLRAGFQLSDVAASDARREPLLLKFPGEVGLTPTFFTAGSGARQEHGDSKLLLATTYLHVVAPVTPSSPDAYWTLATASRLDGAEHYAYRGLGGSRGSLDGDFVDTMVREFGEEALGLNPLSQTKPAVEGLEEGLARLRRVLKFVFFDAEQPELSGDAETRQHFLRLSQDVVERCTGSVSENQGYGLQIGLTVPLDLLYQLLCVDPQQTFGSPASLPAIPDLTAVGDPNLLVKTLAETSDADHHDGGALYVHETQKHLVWFVICRSHQDALRDLINEYNCAPYRARPAIKAKILAQPPFYSILNRTLGQYFRSWDFRVRSLFRLPPIAIDPVPVPASSSST